MFRLLLLALLFATTPLHAVMWKDDALGCSVLLPDSRSWQKVPVPDVLGVTTLVCILNQERQAAFGITMWQNPPNSDLRDRATSDALEQIMRSLKYEFAGNSWVTIGGIDWKQYPVKATIEGKPVSGIVRYTTVAGKIFGVSLLLGGGNDVSQDSELVRIANTFRTFRPVVAQTTPPAGTDPSEPAKPAETAETASAEKPEGDTVQAPMNYQKIGMIAGGALVVLIVLIKIIGSGKPPEPPKKEEKNGKKDAKAEGKPKS